jgi:hypothetical protein
MEQVSEISPTLQKSHIKDNMSVELLPAFYLLYGGFYIGEVPGSEFRVMR